MVQTELQEQQARQAAMVQQVQRVQAEAQPGQPVLPVQLARVEAQRAQPVQLVPWVIPEQPDAPVRQGLPVQMALQVQWESPARMEQREQQVLMA